MRLRKAGMKSPQNAVITERQIIAAHTKEFSDRGKLDIDIDFVYR